MAVGDDNKDRTKSEEASASSDDGISRNGFPLTTMSRVLNILEKSGMKLVPPKSLQAVNSLLCTWHYLLTLHLGQDCQKMA